VSVYRTRDIIAYITGVGVLTKQQLPASAVDISWIIQNVHLPDNIQLEIQTSHCNLKAVSDGSFKEAFRSSGLDDTYQQ
jgi:hypothetical protein